MCDNKPITIKQSTQWGDLTLTFDAKETVFTVGHNPSVRLIFESVNLPGHERTTFFDGKTNKPSRMAFARWLYDFHARNCELISHGLPAKKSMFVPKSTAYSSHFLLSDFTEQALLDLLAKWTAEHK